MKDEEDFDQLLHSLPAGFRDRVLSSCAAPAAAVPQTTLQGDTSTTGSTSHVTRDQEIFDAAATFRRKLGRSLGGIVSSGVVAPAPDASPRSPAGSYSVNVNGRRVAGPSASHNLTTASAGTTTRGRARSRSSGRGRSTSPRSTVSGTSYTSARVGTGVPVSSPMPLLHESSFVQFVARQQAARKRREVRRRLWQCSPDLRPLTCMLVWVQRALTCRRRRSHTGSQVPTGGPHRPRLLRSVCPNATKTTVAARHSSPHLIGMQLRLVTPLLGTGQVGVHAQ